MRRRDFLMAAAGAVVGAGLFYLSRLATDTRPPAAAPAEGSGTVLEATERGFMVKGDINPVLRFSPGEQVSLELRNLLREETIVHWHGFKVDWRNDAHPVFAVKPGEKYRYLFKVANRPGTYFYHPHPHGLTAKQFYMGLVGLVYVETEKSRLGFRHGVNDLPLMLQDRRGATYNPTPMDLVTGFLGDAVAVNGVVNPVFKLEKGTYRFRLVNASNARLYRLAFVDERGEVQPMALIAVDQGFLERKVEVKTLFLAPAERAEVVVEFKREGRYFLKNMPFDPMHNEMMDMGGGHHGHHGGMSVLDEGAEYVVAEFQVSGAGEFVEVEAELPDPPPPPPRAERTRRFHLSLSGMQWVINGMAWDMRNPLKEHVRVEGGTVEIWEITNDVRSMPHPMHLHGFPMWVLQRQNSPPQVADMAVDSSGRLPTDLGLKDTVLVWPGETVKVAVQFDGIGEKQLFPFHCHNLEHEDQGMMINVAVY
ncbi:MAG: multicopper oxidase family protein [Pyrobaculum sp.]